MRVFRYFLYENDMKESPNFDESAKLWAVQLDGVLVRMVTPNIGIADGYAVHKDWCEEVNYGE
jgi:hypothetical protein